MKKRVYEIEVDVNNYQSLFMKGVDEAVYPIEIGTPNGNRVIERETFEFFNRPMPNDWKPLPVETYDPHLPEPDFWRAPESNIAVSENAFEYVQTQFEISGQVLDLPYNKRTLKLFNALHVVDCLDKENCLWDEDDGGQYEDLVMSTERRIVFDPKRIDDLPIFNIPQIPSVLLCIEEHGDPDEEFKAAVEQNGLTGLIFNLLWEES